MRNNEIRKLTRASMILVFALVIIFTGARLGSAVFNQFAVGPLVNAVILTAVLICDLKYGVLVGFLTPLMAALTAQLPSPMAPFVPFIMVGNIVLAVVFGLLYKNIKKWGTYLGIVVGAVLKTLVLSLSARYLVTLLNLGIQKPVAGKLVVMMSAPQLYSAIGGGIVALLLYSVFNRAYRNKTVTC